MAETPSNERRTGQMFRNSQEDIERSEQQPVTPQTEHPAYRLAFNDKDFLTREELRPVRLQLELLKPEMLMNEQGIESTIVVFGSARIPEQGKRSERDYNEETQAALTKNSVYYEMAREFSRKVTEVSKTTDCKEWVICSGGGPGIMEAANRGAHEIGGCSIALNIVLPFEALPNPYVTPALSFQFHYFAIRKMHFLLRAKAVCVFPGGFGTLDEFFEVLTLIQTERVAPMPILIFGREFWEKIINFDALVEAGTVSRKDLDLFHWVDSAEEGWDYIREFYKIEG